MLSDLVLHHWQSANQQLMSDVIEGDWSVKPFALNTCLRGIMLHNQDDATLPGVEETYSGERAYQFMLEVICGLHSPVIGETEVFGQFKAACSRYFDEVKNPAMEKLLRNLHEDAKRVRQKHLLDLGSQSYGSFVRRKLKGHGKIGIIGAGQLAHEIAVWLNKARERKLQIICRDPQKARAQYQWPESVELLPLESRTDQFDALVICAPVANRLLGQFNPHILIDLRGDFDSTASITGGGEYINLAQAFQEISRYQSKSESKRQAAIEDIQQISRKRMLAMEVRPFGWDDVCA